MAVVSRPYAKIDTDTFEIGFGYYVNWFAMFACFFPGILLIIRGIASFYAYRDRNGVELVITESEVWGIPTSMNGQGECRFPLEELREMKVCEDKIKILWMANRRADFVGIENIAEFKKHVEGELGKQIELQNKKYLQEHPADMASVMANIENYKRSISADAEMLRTKQRTRKILKGAVVGGALAGGAGAVVGAIVAKDKLDNKK
ncbi:MAG: hypothetical protein IJW75_01200 [Alphaproteobacteria bacterium]|nr:hypothetical protein [Alphaproteobacteria bacterium]